MDPIRHIIGKQGVHTKYPKFLSDEECDHICSAIDRHEEDVLNIHNPNTSAYMGQLTGQFHVFNWLSLPEVQELNIPDRLFKVVDELQPFKQILIQCWCNTLRKDEGLVLHRHQGDAPHNRTDTIEVYHRRPPMFYSCNIFLGGKHNKTWFETIGDIEHSRGDFMIFDNHIIHEVDNNPYDDVQYSMALDIYPRLPKSQSFANKLRYERT